MLFRWILIVAVVAVFPAHAKTPSILVSIAPLHSVVAAVADGVFAPDLLMQPSQSVHEYRLKPSDLRKISSADAVFYGGRTLEGFLPKAIENAGVRGVSFLSDGDDPHFWLSPSAMARAAEKTAEELARIDQEHADVYRANAESFARAATDLTLNGQRELAAEQGKPFVVFHDAYRAFEREFGLTDIGAVWVDAHRGAGAAHLIELRRKMRQSGKVCLFSEPQMPVKPLETVREGLEVVDGIADPAGTGIKAGKDFYPRLIGNLIRSFKECLSKL